MKYIVGKPFRSHLGQHSVGDELPQAETFKTLESLINTGLIYRVHDEDYSRLPAAVAKAATPADIVAAKINQRSSAEMQPKPVQVAEAERLKDIQENTRRKAHDRIVSTRENRRKPLTRPVEEGFSKRVDKADTRLREAQGAASDFDPDKIRTSTLTELREIATERGISKSGTKPELAQRIIDDEIARERERKESK